MGTRVGLLLLVLLPLTAATLAGWRRVVLARDVEALVRGDSDGVASRLARIRRVAVSEPRLLVPYLDDPRPCASRPIGRYREHDHVDTLVARLLLRAQGVRIAREPSCPGAACIPELAGVRQFGLDEHLARARRTVQR